MSALDITLVVLLVGLGGVAALEAYVFLRWAQGAQRIHSSELEAIYARCREELRVEHEATARREERVGQEHLAERESLLAALRERDTLVTQLLEQISKPVVVAPQLDSEVRRDEDIDAEYRRQAAAAVEWDTDLAPLPGDT